MAHSLQRRNSSTIYQNESGILTLRWEWHHLRWLSSFCIKRLSHFSSVWLATLAVQSGQDLCLRFFAVQISATASPVAMLPYAQRSAEHSQQPHPDNQWEIRISCLSTNCERRPTIGFGHGWVFPPGWPAQSKLLTFSQQSTRINITKTQVHFRALVGFWGPWFDCWQLQVTFGIPWVAF